MISDKYKRFLEWVVYQIYPRSFYDSNGDGIGDLKGVTQKADHLQELGVNAVWLCPCYQSPQVDNGYDISNYRDIAAEFGTLEDWKELRDALHSRGIKLIMDLVPNHTSDKHEWFMKSKQKIPPYSDYYYWADEPRNCWLSCFGGSAWEYCVERGQYYLHSYAKEQPDLNFENPKVREEIKNVIDFWVDLGVDGFRIDVIDQISKDFDGGRNGFGRRLHEYIHELFGREKTENIFTVGECWATDIDEVIRHCAEHRQELSCLFQFDHINHGRKGRFTPAPFSLKKITDDIAKWQALTSNNGILYTLFTDNHDQPRFLSRFGNDKELRFECATLFAGIFYLGYGIPFIYQGQEFGTTNSYHQDFSTFKDVENKHFYYSLQGQFPNEELIARLNFGSRDNARHPIAWNGEKYGGFSVVQPWIDLHSRYNEINLEKDKASEQSIFEFYKKLLCFRKNSPTILYGSYKEVTAENTNCYIYEREYQGEKIVIVCNFEKENEIVLPYKNTQFIFGNYNAERMPSGRYSPYELAVYKV